MKKTNRLAREMHESYEKMMLRLNEKQINQFSVFVNGYRSGYNKHREMMTKKNGSPVRLQTYEDSRTFHLLVTRAIRRSMKDHPELKGTELTGCIAKRILMQLNAE